ncbi:class I SAM-dependent methyltransferase [Nannocystis radixulma]|uniref:Methyltransferase domain-containing protein n=1 Tax=Nannocystis radixulma TaxID=2995305 RepID=A0ABT5BJL4_9BACT|nr:methyltransferase domain-containing protein [Nannocystis radixulma]MDC0673131.1 methyltransferase domain-containing protein [Nannocystis radixulma]
MTHRSPPPVLTGSRFAYPLRRARELCGGVVVELDVVASLDAAIDALCDEVGRSLDDAEALRLVPYFGTLWAAGRALAAHIGERPALVRGRRVIEVGCGIGLPALVAARLGAHVLACDAHPDVLALLRRNAALNDVVIAYHPGDVADPDALVAALGTADLVLASDVAYEAGLATQIAPALARLCRPGGLILLADPGRPLFQSTVNALEALGYRSEVEIRRARRGDDSATTGAAATDSEQEVFVVSFEDRAVEPGSPQ